MKKLAIIGASYLQEPLIQKAIDMGIETHVFAWASGDVGEDIADYFYPISIIEKEEILEKCKQIGIDGICTIASDLAVAITSKRIDLGLTQKEFAEKIGKTQTMISKWENADCNFTIKTLIEIAQKLDLTLGITLKEKEPQEARVKCSTNKVIQFPGRYYGASSPEQIWTRNVISEEELKEM